MSRKKKQVTPDVQQQRDERRKARNRIAARKCRDKRDNRVQTLEDEKTRQLEWREKLADENGRLRAEIERIKENLPREEEQVNNNEPELEGFNDILENPDEYLADNMFAMCE
jgi:hypothetical protein